MTLYGFPLDTLLRVTSGVLVGIDGLKSRYTPPMELRSDTLTSSLGDSVLGTRKSKAGPAPVAIVRPPSFSNDTDQRRSAPVPVAFTVWPGTSSISCDGDAIFG